MLMKQGKKLEIVNNMEIDPIILNYGNYHSNIAYYDNIV